MIWINSYPETEAPLLPESQSAISGKHIGIDQHSLDAGYAFRGNLRRAFLLLGLKHSPKPYDALGNHHIQKIYPHAGFRE